MAQRITVDVIGKDVCVSAEAQEEFKRIGFGFAQSFNVVWQLLKLEMAQRGTVDVVSGTGSSVNWQV